MDPKTVIESYVDHVVRAIPRGQRADVGFELCSLLGEELEGMAQEAGRPADDAMALALLNRFGPPWEVAERYGPPGFLIIRPAAGRSFAWAALIGLGVQWVLTLTAALMHPQSHVGAPGSIGDIAAQISRWWLSWGLGAFWFPGFMVVVAIVAAWLAQLRPDSVAWAPRHALDPDRIHRPFMAACLAAWGAYMVFLAFAPWVAAALPRPLAAVFAFDDGFLAARGPWLFPVWGAQYLVCVAVLVEGRWRRRTRELYAASGAALCAVLAWFAVGGPIFKAHFTDSTTRGLIGLIVLLSLISLVVDVYRRAGRPHSPKGLPTL